MDEMPSKKAALQGIGKTTSRAPLGVALARYQLSVKNECTVRCITEYRLLISAGVLPLVVLDMVLLLMVCDMVLDIVDDTKLIPWLACPHE